MHYSLLLLLLLTFCTFLTAEQNTFDPSSRSIEVEQIRKERVDTFDFAGTFPELENIAINARRKKNVEFKLTGAYPVLEKIIYEGSFGVLNGKLTGKFPKLSHITFACTNCAMNFDLNGEWERSCEIFFHGTDQNITLSLPKDVGLVIHTKTAFKGKVLPFEGLTKTTRFGFFKKSFENELAQTAPIVLTIHIEAADGHIVLN